MRQLTTNDSESLFLRTWYGLYGCNCPLTETAFSKLCLHLSSINAGTQFNIGEVDYLIVESFIAQTAWERRRKTGAAYDPEFPPVVKVTKKPLFKLNLDKLKGLLESSIPVTS